MATSTTNALAPSPVSPILSRHSDTSRKSESPPIHGIDAEKLLAATNCEDALKILNQATTTSFSMCSEATKLMSTLQMSAIPSTSADNAAFKEFNQMHMYNPMQNPIHSHPFEIPENISAVRIGYVLIQHVLVQGFECCFVFIRNFQIGDIQNQYSSSTDEGVETDLEDHTHRHSYASSSSSSGVVTNFTNSKTLSQNLSCDSNFESLEYPLTGIVDTTCF